MSHLGEVDQILQQHRIMEMERKLPFTIFFLLCLWLMGGFAGCGCLTGSKKTESAEVLAEKGMAAFEDQDYHDALEAFTTLKERYPYSRYAILAELKVADAHFHRKEYPEAVAAYEDFIQLHPKNEAIPYVLYQIGACYYEQLLSEHELYVALFYFKSKHYRAALVRLEGALADYSDVLPSEKQSQVKKLIIACKEQLAEPPGIDAN